MDAAKNKRKFTKSDRDTTVRTAFRAFLVSLAAGAAMLLIMSVIAYSQGDPNSFVTPFAHISLAVGAASGGFAAAKMRESGILPSALLCAGMTVALMALCSIAADSKGGLLESLALYASVPAMSVLGALIGAKRARKPRKHKHK